MTLPVNLETGYDACAVKEDEARFGLPKWLTPDKFYKRGSQEKTHLHRPEFFLLLSPLDRARFVLTYRTMCSVSRPCDPAVWVFTVSGFHRFFATKPFSSETSKAERRSDLATIVLSGTRGP